MPPKPDDPSSTHDLYGLLGVDPTAPLTPSLLRKSFRKASLLVHPDKNPSPDAAAQFHLLTIAFDVLSDPASKTAYDNARRVKQEARVRHEQLDAKRRKLREELESREKNAVGQAQAEREAEAAFQRELSRLKMQGAKLRQEREEALRRARDEEESGEDEQEEREKVTPASRFSELDRTVRVRWRNKGEGRMLDSEGLEKLFGRFGKVSHCLVKEPKVEEGKEKKVRSGLVVFESIVGAVSAKEEGEKLKDGDFKELKDIDWAGGKAPEGLTELRNMTAPHLSAIPPQRVSTSPPPAFLKSTPLPSKTSTTSRKMPSFGSFNKTAVAGTAKSSPYAAAAGIADSPDYESFTMLRMKQAAEKRRLEEEILRREREEEEEK